MPPKKNILSQALGKVSGFREKLQRLGENEARLRINPFQVIIITAEVFLCGGTERNIYSDFRGPNLLWQKSEIPKKIYLI